MDRENLFRGKRIDTGEWAYGDLCTGLGGHKYIMQKCYRGEAIEPYYKLVMFGGWDFLLINDGE